MTSLKFKNKNSRCLINNLYLIVAIGAICALACLGLTVLNSNVANADQNNMTAEIPQTNFGFKPDGIETDTNVPFTFYQKTVSVNGQDMDKTYTYRLYSVDGTDVPMPDGKIGTEYTFTMTGDEEHTFYIDYKKDYDAYNTVKYFYKCEMVVPNPQKQNYTYDNTTFEVSVEVHDMRLCEGNKLHVFCFNPSGEKVFNPGWTITFDEPLPPSSNPPKTIDPIWLTAIIAAAIVLLIAILIFVDKHNRKKNTKQLLS